MSAAALNLFIASEIIKERIIGAKTIHIYTQLMDWTQETKLKSREAELIFDIRGTYIEVLPQINNLTREQLEQCIVQS